MPAALPRLVAAAALAGLWLVAPVAAVASPCAAAGPHHAAIVVEHGDGTFVSRCVAFSGASVTGQQLLELSGIEVQTQTFGGFGEAVCQVDGEPARYSSCLGTDRYWAYFVARAGGGWQFSSIGISNVALRDGDAEGFRFEPSTGSPGPPPSPARVCAAARASAPATPRPPSATTMARTAATAGASAMATGVATPAAAATGQAPATPAETAAASTEPPAFPSLAAAASPGPANGGLASTSGSGGPDTGLLVAAGAGAVLVALVLVQALVRRRPR